jgi:hypothetical protein
MSQSKRNRSDFINRVSVRTRWHGACTACGGAPRTPARPDRVIWLPTATPRAGGRRGIGVRYSVGAVFAHGAGMRRDRGDCARYPTQDHWESAFSVAPDSLHIPNQSETEVGRQFTKHTLEYTRWKKSIVGRHSDRFAAGTAHAGRTGHRKRGLSRPFLSVSRSHARHLCPDGSTSNARPLRKVRNLISGRIDRSRNAPRPEHYGRRECPDVVCYVAVDHTTRRRTR